MARAQRAQLVSVVILATAICASAETRKEFRFTVGPRRSFRSPTSMGRFR